MALFHLDCNYANMADEVRLHLAKDIGNLFSLLKCIRNLCEHAEYANYGGLDDFEAIENGVKKNYSSHIRLLREVIGFTKAHIFTFFTNMIPEIME